MGRQLQPLCMKRENPASTVCQINKEGYCPENGVSVSGDIVSNEGDETE